MAKEFFYHCGTNEHGLKEGHRPSTVAGVLEGTTLRIGIAQTSPCDKFQKKLGRKIASGRAENKPIKVIELPEAFNGIVEHKDGQPVFGDYNPQEHPGRYFNQLAHELTTSNVTKVLYPAK